jgi:hypothetical protein
MKKDMPGSIKHNPHRHNFDFRNGINFCRFLDLFVAKRFACFPYCIVIIIYAIVNCYESSTTSCRRTQPSISVPCLGTPVTSSVRESYKK